MPAAFAAQRMACPPVRKQHVSCRRQRPTSSLPSISTSPHRQRPPSWSGAAADGTGGTELRVDPGAGTVLLKDRVTGTVLASGAVPPDSFAAGQLNRVQLTVRGAEATALINGVEAVSGPAGTAAGSGFGLRVSGGGAYFQNVRADDVASYMNGLYQPGYHYSQNSGNSSDPNGLVYFRGRIPPLPPGPRALGARRQHRPAALETAAHRPAAPGGRRVVVRFRGRGCH